MATEVRPTAGIAGLHHVTAIASDARANLRFYEGVLGLRLVKQTVNFDDPGTYHLYFGDAHGSPGSILTFFPWAGALPGRAGTGMTMATAFAVPPNAIEFWMGRFADLAIDFEAPSERYGDDVLRFKDPDGLPLELIQQKGSERGTADPRAIPPLIPADAAITGFHGVSLCVAGYERSARLLTDVFGYAFVGQEGERFRFQSSGAGQSAGSYVDLLCQPDTLVRGRSGAGTVHHVAFRARDEEQQLQWREKVREFGLDVTPVLDRNYFRSIYFREPGGVLYEIATDPPGFAADEALEHLGETLKLPDWLEPRRASIEARLPALRD
ncbi:MAG: ring-cleaving dioxygenase [Bryobacterales bacterium]|nr:ring-cleaving dioxygenase [Bryobacterales bacterium]